MAMDWEPFKFQVVSSEKVSTPLDTSDSSLDAKSSSIDDHETSCHLPSLPGSHHVYPVGGSVSTDTIHSSRQATGPQALEVVGAFMKEGEDSDYDVTVERKGQGLNKEVHLHLTKTEIHQPTAVTVGGHLHVGNLPKSLDSDNAEALTPLQKLRRETQKTLDFWTKDMVITGVVTTILNKIKQGRTWLTVQGNPGEGKTTACLLALKRLHDQGREVFVVKTQEDYFKAKESKQPVILLDDIFGALSFDPEKLKKWQDVLSDALAFSEHKPEIEKIPEKIVILISRQNVQKAASKSMGKFKQVILKNDNVVDFTKQTLEKVDRMKIWKSHSTDIDIDTRIVKKVCSMSLKHGFPHCCKLFAEMYSKNNHLDMRKFFSKPLDYLNESMESFMMDSLTGPLLRQILKNDGWFDLDSVDDRERRYQYSSAADILTGLYVVVKGTKLEFNHPSVYDSAAFVICQVDPSFVIDFCSLSFLNERVRTQREFHRSELSDFISRLCF